MEPKGSLPCPQEPATAPYPIDTFKPYFCKIHFNIILHLRLGPPSDLFPPGFPTKILYAFLISPIR
jgi:hypothetical protein